MKTNSIAEFAKSTASQFERRFELQFENLARDPKVLAMAASAINFTVNTRIQLATLESELKSLGTRLLLRRRNLKRRTGRK